VPLPNETVQILANGKPVATAITGANGTYMVPVKLTEGSYGITAAYHYLDQVYSSKPAHLTIAVPWYKTPIPYGIVTAVIAVIVVLMPCRKTRS